ncbi:hypothetical protein ACFV2Q_02930 [Streptomyces sp. NPDC059650]|uniref:hypothetical protein n=1 Tax=Streptomyces sp. NPDC059650 TaxID=3346896 RepID=UPI00368CFB80
MAVWQYFAGAGLVAVCCPLHGQVAVDDGGGSHAARASARASARADACVPDVPAPDPGGRAPVGSPPAVRPPAGSPAVRPPAGSPPAVRPPWGRAPAVVPPVVRLPAVRLPDLPAPHAGVPALPFVVPGADRPTVRHPGLGPLPAAGASAGSPAAKALAAAAQPPAAAADPAVAVGPAAGGAGAPPALGAPAGRVSAFHVRPYRSQALARREPGGLSTVMLMAVVTTPAVLAAAALRPRSKSRTS